jgi:hypothetical protein
MSSDTLAALGTVLALTAIAFAVSFAVGIVIARLGVTEPDDLVAIPPPEEPAQPVDVRPATRPMRSDKSV